MGFDLGENGRDGNAGSVTGMRRRHTVSAQWCVVSGYMTWEDVLCAMLSACAGDKAMPTHFEECGTGS